MLLFSVVTAYFLVQGMTVLLDLSIYFEYFSIFRTSAADVTKRTLCETSFTNGATFFFFCAKQQVKGWFRDQTKG